MRPALVLWLLSWLTASAWLTRQFSSYSTRWRLVHHAIDPAHASPSPRPAKQIVRGFERAKPGKQITSLYKPRGERKPTAEESIAAMEKQLASMVHHVRLMEKDEPLPVAPKKFVPFQNNQRPAKVQTRQADGMFQREAYFRPPAAESSDSDEEEEEEEEDYGEYKEQYTGDDNDESEDEYAEEEEDMASSLIPSRPPAQRPRPAPRPAALDLEYRLRKPPLIDPMVEARLRKAAERKEWKEGQAAYLHQEALRKHTWVPFDFDANIRQFSENSSLQIFSTMSFEEVGIKDTSVLEVLEHWEIFHPTKIQQTAIPKMIAGKSIVMHAQTGSGKTLAYLLPLLELVDANKRKVQAVIIAPSRELVSQIGKVSQQIFEGTNISTVTLIGGANLRGQLEQLRDKRPQVIVATPGRLAEIVFKYDKIHLGNVKVMVIDEVDNLMQDIYQDELRTLIEATPAQRAAPMNSTFSKVQPFVLCLASATARNSTSVKDFADQYAPNGWEVAAVHNSAMLPGSVTHCVIASPRIKALELLKKLLHTEPVVQRALIFVNDPHRVQVVYEQLYEKGVLAAPLHGDASKDDRKEVINRIKDGRLQLVVTTELAARGLDIPDLTHVINFELPTDSAHYVHRAGRVGRAGRPGLVVNFATANTKHIIRRFSKQLGAKMMDCELREGKVWLRSP